MIENPENRKYIKSKGIIYEIIKKLRERYFGDVYLTKIKDSNEIRIIRIYDKNKIRDKLAEKRFEIPTDEEMKNLYLYKIYNEIENMKILVGKNNENRNAIKLYDSFENKDEIGLICENCDQTFSFFLNRINNINPYKIINDTLNHLNNSFEIIYKKKLIHRAIGFGNIMIQYTNKEKTKYIVKLKITDDAILLTDLIKTKNYSGLNGDYNYFAPEVLKGEEYDEKCDLWSLGVVIYEIYFRELPFVGDNEIKLLNCIKNNYNNFLKKLDSIKEPLLKDLIFRLINPDAKSRYNWTQYFSHSLFRKNNKCEKYYELIKEIGNTEFARVYKAKEKAKEKNELKAIKIYSKERIKNQIRTRLGREINKEDMKPYIDDFNREIELMKIIQGENDENENSVKLFEYFDNDDELAIVMELCDNNLSRVFLESKPFTVDQIFDLLNQLNNSFRILFEKKLVHMALNLKNILVKYRDKENSKYIYKLKLTNDSNYFENLIKKNKLKIIDKRFTAPEILKGEKCKLNSDLWSLGIIIYVLYFRVYPYNGNMLKELLNDINKIGKNFTKKIIDSNLDDLMRNLLTADSKERMTWEKYFAHPFFKNKIDKLNLKNDYKKEYEILEDIGYLGYATISKAKKKDNGELRAIKIYNLRRLQNDLKRRLTKPRPLEPNDFKPYKDRFLNEIKYMRIIQGENNDNKNSIIFYDSFENENEWGIVMELGDKNLQSFIEEKKSLRSKDIYDILSQLNNSFKIMYQNKIVHRALNLANILIKYDREKKNILYKLLMIDDCISLNDLPNNPIMDFPETDKRYFAPELLEKNSNYNEKCDLWSLGIIIYYLLFEEYPYSGKTEEDILNNIKSIGQNFRETSDNNLNDLMKNLLNCNIEERFGWGEYFRHRFFKRNQTSVY